VYARAPPHVVTSGARIFEPEQRELNPRLEQSLGALPPNLTVVQEQTARPAQNFPSRRSNLSPRGCAANRVLRPASPGGLGKVKDHQHIEAFDLVPGHFRAPSI